MPSLHQSLLLHGIFSTSALVLFPDKAVLLEQSRPRKDVGSEPVMPCPKPKNDSQKLAGSEIFCEEAEDYPTNYTLDPNLLSNQFIKNTLFNNRSSNDIKVRFGDEVRACDSLKSTVYPKKARNTNGAFVFIVNDEQYRQAVDIEQCVGEGEVCENDSDAPSFGETVCRQKYATYKMYVINEEGEQVYDSFSLPSACLCHHKSSFAIRGGLRDGENSHLPFCPKAEALSIQESKQLVTDPAPTPIKSETNSKSSGIIFERKKRQVSYVPKACKNKNYCENEEENEDLNNLVLKQLNSNTELSPELFQQLYDSRCNGPIVNRGYDIEGLGNRFDFNIDEEQLCFGSPTIIYPRKAKNLDEKWRYVVNIGNYTQSVEIEECHHFNDYEDDDADHSDSVQFKNSEDEEEKDFGSCHYSGSEGNNPDLTVCRQLFTEHKLLALSEEGQLIVDSFKLPSACACFVREDLKLEFRIEMKDEEKNEDDKETTTLPQEKDGSFTFSG